MFATNSNFNKAAWVKRGFDDFLKTYANHHIYSTIPQNKRVQVIKSDWEEMTGKPVTAASRKKSEQEQN